MNPLARAGGRVTMLGDDVESELSDTQRFCLRSFTDYPLPTTDADRTVRKPVGYQKLLSVGAGRPLSDDLNIDAACAYLYEDAAEFNQPLYEAAYRNSTHNVSTRLTYCF